MFTMTRLHSAAAWLCLKELHEKDGLVSEGSFQYWTDASRGLSQDQ
jgi:hypothetical protein